MGKKEYSRRKLEYMFACRLILGVYYFSIVAIQMNPAEEEGKTRYLNDPCNDLAGVSDEEIRSGRA
jgi:hypothetical protein